MEAIEFLINIHWVIISEFEWKPQAVLAFVILVLAIRWGFILLHLKALFDLN